MHVRAYARTVQGFLRDAMTTIDDAEVRAMAALLDVDGHARSVWRVTQMEL